MFLLSSSTTYTLKTLILKVIGQNSHMKTWSLKVIGQTVACIVPTRFYRQSAKVDLDLWLHDPKSRVLLLSLSTIYAWILKVIGQKKVVCIVPTRLYRQSAKVNLDLWPHGQKSIGFLLSSWKKRSDPVPETKAPLLTEHSKKQSDNAKHNHNVW